MIRARDKRRNNIYKSFVGSNRMNGMREKIPLGGTIIFKSSRI